MRLAPSQNGWIRYERTEAQGGGIIPIVRATDLSGPQALRMVLALPQLHQNTVATIRHLELIEQIMEAHGIYDPSIMKVAANNALVIRQIEGAI